MADAADLEAPAVDEVAEPVLLRSDAEGVVGLTLNRPDQYNALSRELLAKLQTELDLIKDDPAVRVVVITGTGRAFCAGHDLKEMAGERERAQAGRAVRRVQQDDALAHPAAAAGDRAGRRHRHRGRLPAGRGLRSGARHHQRPLRHLGRQVRPVLLDADGRALAQRAAQAGDGDAAHRRLHRGRRRAPARAGQSGGRARQAGGSVRRACSRACSTSRPRSWRSASAPSTGSSRWGSRTPTTSPPR